jgi:predicted transcriptional regulator
MEGLSALYVHINSELKSELAAAADDLDTTQKILIEEAISLLLAQVEPERQAAREAQLSLDGEVPLAEAS